MQDPEWTAVAQAASRTRGWLILTSTPESLRAALDGCAPTHAMVIAMPDEAGRARCARWQRAFRALDADPFADARWGIVTAPRPDVAMRIVSRVEPLVLGACLGTTAVPTDVFDRSVWFSEGVLGEVHEQVRGAADEEVRHAHEQSAEFAIEWNRDWADFIYASGRSNEMRWLLGYSYSGGRVVPRRGALTVLDAQGVPHEVASARSKAMLAPGNCLIAHTRDEDCLAMALLDAGGVDQLAGYTSVTFDGRAGWGTASWMFDEPGRWSLAESVHWSRQELLARMQRAHDGDLALVLDAFDRSDRLAFMEQAQHSCHQWRAYDAADRVGALWDRDAFVLLGDPARRVAPRDGTRRWVGGVEWREGVPWAVVRALGDVPPAAPPTIELPGQCADASAHMNQGEWCVADDFAMLLEPGAWRAGMVWEVPLRMRAAEYALPPTKGTR